MNRQRDPRIAALVVELAESSRSAPDFVDIEERSIGEGNAVRTLSPKEMSTLDLRSAQTRWAAIAAAVVILLLVGGAAWLLRPGGTSEPADQPFTTTPPPNTSQPPAQDLLALEWSRNPGRTSDGTMLDVVAGGPGLVAVGLDSERDGANAAVWTSSDGVQWSRVPHDEAIFGGEGQGVTAMTGVTAGGPGLVAVGFSGPGLEENAAVWTSVDGIEWSRVAHDGDIFGGGVMRDVAVGGPGLVAVGRSDPAGNRAAAWTSVDGVTWSRVPDENGIVGVSTAELGTVIAGGPGVVALGTDATVLTSSDGIVWTQVFVGGNNYEMADITVGGPGLVAVGQIDDPPPPGAPSPGEQAAVWVSIDGSSWSSVLHDEAVFGTENSVRMRAVAATGSGMVAVGSINSNAATWVSEDGVSWTRRPHDGQVFTEASMEAVTPWNSGLVAVGGGDQWVANQNR